MIDKELANKLRKQGLTYKQVADTVGCSVEWCKKNLKGTKQEFAVADGQVEAKMAAIAILEDALMKLRGI
jgi:cyanate lyase